MFTEEKNKFVNREERIDKNIKTLVKYTFCDSNFLRNLLFQLEIFASKGQNPEFRKPNFHVMNKKIPKIRNAKFFTTTSKNFFNFYSLLLNSFSQVPTWTAYDSLITKENLTTTFCSLPIIFGSPAEWDNLFSSLKKVQKINDLLSPGTKTIVTLDLQLYSKALQLESNSKIDNFVIRLGELHVVFTAFKMLGKIIDGSGLDKAFEEALIYGSNTVEQIKDGHHLYRCFEGHQILYLSLVTNYIVPLIDSHPLIEKDLREDIINAITIIENQKQEANESFRENHQKLIELISSIDFISLQTEFDE